VLEDVTLELLIFKIYENSFHFTSLGELDRIDFRDFMRTMKHQHLPSVHFGVMASFFLEALSKLFIPPVGFISGFHSILVSLFIFEFFNIN
jgi:hypothetical protein